VPTHAPFMQASPVVQVMPSLHVVPLVTFMKRHVPLAAQAPALQGLGGLVAQLAVPTQTPFTHVSCPGVQLLPSSQDPPETGAPLHWPLVGSQVLQVPPQFTVLVPTHAPPLQASTVHALLSVHDDVLSATATQVPAPPQTWQAGQAMTPQQTLFVQNNPSMQSLDMMQWAPGLFLPHEFPRQTLGGAQPVLLASIMHVLLQSPFDPHEKGAHERAAPPLVHTPAPLQTCAGVCRLPTAAQDWATHTVPLGYF
jgi:hypothetical protein